MKTLGPKFGKNAAAARDAIGQLDGKVVEGLLSRGEPVMINVAGQATAIDAEDVAIVKSYGGDWAGADDGQTVVMIDKRLTPELKNEGIARDLVRNIQNLRKQAGLDIADRIKLRLDTSADGIRTAIDAFGAYIVSETLAVAMTSDPLIVEGTNDPPTDDAPHAEVKINGEPVRIELVKTG